MRTILAVAAAFLITACTAPETGRVVTKHYEPPNSWTEMRCVFRHQNGTCASYTTVTHTDPERWVLTLRNGDDQGDRAVYREAYERCPVGSTYPKCAEAAQ